MRHVGREFDGFRTRFSALPVAVGARRWYHSICRLRFPTSVYIDLTRSLHHFKNHCRRSAKLHIFHSPLVFLSRIRDHICRPTTIRVGIGTQAANTMTYPVVCQFPIFVALCDYNRQTLQTDRRTPCSSDKRNMLKKKTTTPVFISHGYCSCATHCDAVKF